MKRTADNKRALVINLKHIGDVLCSTPVLTGLKTAGYQTTALVDAVARPVIKKNPVLDHFLAYERNQSFFGRLKHELGLIRRIRRARFDLVIDLSEGDRGAFWGFLSRAPVRVGLGSRQGKPRERLMTKVLPRHPLDRPAPHIVRRNLEALAAIGIDAPDTPLSVSWSDEVDIQVDELLAEAGLEPGGFAVVHPTSRWMFKAWTPNGNAEVIDHLAQKQGLRSVITAAPDKTELDFIEKIVAHTTSNPVNLAGKLSLDRLAVLIARARVFFGVDSAPMHLAAAVGTPTVVLFGPSGEHMWGPWMVDHEVVGLDMDCRPCGGAGCDDSGVSRCLIELDSEEVIAALHRILARPSSGEPQ